MVRVDFHILSSSDAHTRLIYACRLTDKARARNHRVYLRVADEALASELDALLWTFRDRSFVPHAIDAPGAADEAVLIGTGDAPSRGEPDLLVNLAPDPVAAPERFRRIVEVGDDDQAVRQAARNRFRWYRERGIEPEHRTVDVS
ncbi:DNA polymerase III subunit chi [Aquisalimonas sp.]|uniref:DNA polymerase III subunit chi n=1 Tax=Aquisalimonas sp. TaxID=1872621 RepID=UPI0025BE1009|nr:DNA polymerase III subunit chi [Aquisalimonas sp.]